MSHASTYEPKTAFTRWLDSTFADYPLHRGFYGVSHPAKSELRLDVRRDPDLLPRRCNSSLASSSRCTMRQTRLLAFDLIEKMMRDVNYGWLMRYTHAVGASLFFLAVYIHIFRGLYYGSYKAPREVLWIIGVAILDRHDRHRLHGLLACLGPDELLGRDRDHEPVLIARLGHSGPRHNARAVDLGRLLGR